jgi:HTH-type transcriptional regulator/antitoxin HigA
MATNTQIEDFATAPGETLLDSLEALGMSQVELAERIGLDKKTINLIINGTQPITHKTALALEKVLRVPARFWLNLEAGYREHLARVEEAKQLAVYADWARTFPYPAMVKNGFIEAASKAEEKAMHLLRYFGVATPQRWQSCYAEMHLELSYRKSPHVDEKLAGIASWLRQGELRANQTETAEFDAKRFQEALVEMRTFTTDSVTEFYPKMQALCASAGVIYQLVPELPGLGVSGVMRWFQKRPMIQQSLLFKTNDHFWFTFFHEAKHVLQQRKKSIFLEGEKADNADATREEEANRFAGELLIPSAEFESFVTKTPRFTSPAVCDFAESVGIHPGIVSGRLLREKQIAYAEPAARLRTKFAWKK